jgi:hypothetical protein
MRALLARRLGLDLQRHMVFQHFRDGAWYAHFRLRSTPVLRDHLPLCGPMTEPVSGSLIGRGQLSNYPRGRSTEIELGPRAPRICR